MSKSQAIICDECGRQIINGQLYEVEITRRYKPNAIFGFNIMNGDYCKECYYKLLKENLEKDLREKDF